MFQKKTYFFYKLLFVFNFKLVKLVHSLLHVLTAMIVYSHFPKPVLVPMCFVGI